MYVRRFNKWKAQQGDGFGNGRLKLRQVILQEESRDDFETERRSS